MVDNHICPCGGNEFKWDEDRSYFPDNIIPSVEEYAMELTYTCVECGREASVVWSSEAFEFTIKE